MYSSCIKKGNIATECPLVSKERLVDVGGVKRDMLSGFWETTYKKVFEGHLILTPMFHSQTDYSVFPILGRQISRTIMIDYKTNLIPMINS